MVVAVKGAGAGLDPRGTLIKPSVGLAWKKELYVVCLSHASLNGCTTVTPDSTQNMLGSGVTLD